MTTKILFTAHMHTVGGRDGWAKSSDNQLDVKLLVPGSNRPGTNPEQLFAAGWSACNVWAVGCHSSQPPRKSSLEQTLESPASSEIWSIMIRTRAARPEFAM